MDIVIERVNKGNCPVCNQPLGDEEVIFEEYNGSHQPVHKRHKNPIKDVK